MNYSEKRKQSKNKYRKLHIGTAATWTTWAFEDGDGFLGFIQDLKHRLTTTEPEGNNMITLLHLLPYRYLKT